MLWRFLLSQQFYWLCPKGYRNHLPLRLVHVGATQNILQDWTNLSAVPEPQRSRWEWNTRAWALLIEPGRKKRKLKWRSADDCADNLRNRCENKHSGNHLKDILVNDEQQTAILHNYVLWEVHIESQNNKIVTSQPRKCPSFRNSGSIFQSNPYSFCQGSGFCL